MTQTPQQPESKPIRVTRFEKFFPWLVMLLLLLIASGGGVYAYRVFLVQSSRLDEAQKDIQEQKDTISGLNTQINSLNDKVKQFKKDADDTAQAVSAQKDSTASLKKEVEDYSSKLNDLNQEFDDKFGRLSKELTDVKTSFAPVKEGITAIKEENKKWQKEYVSALSDLQNHVTRAAGLISQMRDEVNKKIEYISMVQEKMIKDQAAVSAIQAASTKAVVPSEEIVHHQVLSNDLPEPVSQIDHELNSQSKK